MIRGSKDSKDYHQEMNGDCFNDWFEHQLLPVLDNPSVIVLDNATYHNVRVLGTKSPTMAWRKPRIIEWPQNRNIGLKTILQQGISEPIFYGDLVYKFKRVVGKTYFSDQFKKIVKRYIRVGNNLDIMRQSACLVLNPITV